MAAQEPQIYWQGAYVKESMARRLMGTPIWFQELDNQLNWLHLSPENQSRLRDDQRALFVKAPDCFYIVSYKLYFDHDFIKIFRQGSGKSIWYLIVTRRGTPHNWPTRVLQVSAPRFEQRMFTFTVLGLSGDVIGEYSYGHDVRVTVANLVARVRRDLDESAKRMEALN
jgi:hypothetical protein